MFLNKTAENNLSLVEQASIAADQAIKSTEQQGQQALETLVESMQNLRHQAAPMLERASDKVSAITHRGIDSVRETSHQLRVKAEHAADNTVSYIRQEPVKSVLIAAATGAALMALVSLASRARDRS